jgi:ATP-dependent exoDNAse (exonuclease V) beta subunit
MGTFHGFCASLLGENAAAAGLPLSMTVMDGAAAKQLLHEAALEAVASAMRGDARAETLELLEEMGIGAHWGLLSNVVGLMASLGERGLRAQDLTPAVFPTSDFDAARADLPLQIRSFCSLLKTPAARARVPELSLAARALEDAVDGDAAMFALSSAYTALAGGFGGAALADSRNALKEQVTQAVASWASQQGTHVASLFKQLLVRTEAAYQQRKADAAAWDFTDLLSQTRDMLLTHPEVRQRLRTRYQAILVDEMQDTSPIQAQLLTLLLDERDTPPLDVRDAAIPPGRLLLVGDRKQSIYGFRGANVSLFEDAHAALLRSGGEERFLQESRRSSATLTPVLNRLSAHALQDAWRPSDELTAVREDGLPTPLHRVRATLPDGATMAEARAAEARALANHLAHLLSRHGPLPDLTPSDVVVLLRKRIHAETFRAALEAAGVPARVGRGGDLLSRPEVMDATALLSLLTDPSDAHALATVLRSPFIMLRDDVLVRLSVTGEKLALHARAVLVDPLPPGVESTMTSEERTSLWKLRRLVEALAGKVNVLDAGDALLACLDALDGWAVMELHADGAARAANLRALELLLRGRTVPEAARFLRESQLAGVTFPLGMPETDAGQVGILTIHEAKGLEWKVVVLADMASGVGGLNLGAVWHPTHGLAARAADHPSGVVKQSNAPTPIRQVQAALRDDQDAETRRLLYVALTRARDLLVLSGEAPRNAPDVDTFLARLQHAVEGESALGTLHTVTDPAPVVRAHPRRASHAPAAPSAQLSLLAAAPSSAPVERSATQVAMTLAHAQGGAFVPLPAVFRVPRARWGRADDVDARRALVATGVPHPDDAMVAAVKAVHATPVMQALAKVPRSHGFVDVDAFWAVPGQLIRGTLPLLTQGVDAEPWLLLDVVLTATPEPPAILLRRLELHAVMVARAMKPPVLTTLLCHVCGGVPRFEVASHTSAQLSSLETSLLQRLR